MRLLSAADRPALYRILTINGLLRFPLVLAYCLLGLALAAYALEKPEFLDQLPLTASGAPNLNLVFPAFVLDAFAPGLAGLAIVGLFAAAMSSIDSALNSLSASTVEDFLPNSATRDERFYFRQSKIVTLGWGLFAVALSFSVEHIAATVLEAINKIGSMANGPLLALFVLAALHPGAGTRPVLAGFAAGLIVNAALWLFAPGVSWLWWNVSGFLAALAGTMLLCRGASPVRETVSAAVVTPPRMFMVLLGGGFIVLLFLLLYLQLVSDSQCQDLCIHIN